MSVICYKTSTYECESVKAVKCVCHTPNECDLTGLVLVVCGVLVVIEVVEVRCTRDCRIFAPRRKMCKAFLIWHIKWLKNLGGL